MNLKDSVQLEFGSVIGLLKREMESGPITNLYLNLIRSKQLARECKQTACEPSLLSIFEPRQRPKSPPSWETKSIGPMLTVLLYSKQTIQCKEMQKR